jgi:hypothetical protein
MPAIRQQVGVAPVSWSASESGPEIRDALQKSSRSHIEWRALLGGKYRDPHGTRPRRMALLLPPRPASFAPESSPVRNKS